MISYFNIFHIFIIKIYYLIDFLSMNIWNGIYSYYILFWIYDRIILFLLFLYILDIVVEIYIIYWYICYYSLLLKNIFVVEYF